ncbi:unnamed protein product [Haemonchus placei]|uniref:Integrase catalytic domain-containing protein n=1 Tax=Haemonchus placei TaxID=6290 RepID=A0A0N4WBH8_HAEPC|nr:unnamed protein product [Haemonchus placei]
MTPDSRVLNITQAPELWEVIIISDPGNNGTTGEPWRQRCNAITSHQHPVYLGHSNEIPTSSMDDELALLRLYIKEASVASSFENSLNLVLDGIDRQFATAAIIRSDWAHMKGEPLLNFSPPQEQVIVLNRIES